MDADRARRLLARERERIQQAYASLGHGELDEPGDEGSETLYQNEFDAARAATLAAELEAVERAEERLSAGTYGLSIESGKPIGDDRLEALPTAERTVVAVEHRERR